MKISETIRIAPPAPGRVANENARWSALKGITTAKGTGATWDRVRGSAARCFECGWDADAESRDDARALADAHAPRCRAESRDDARAAVKRALASDEEGGVPRH